MKLETHTHSMIEIHTHSKSSLIPLESLKKRKRRISKEQEIHSILKHSEHQPKIPKIVNLGVTQLKAIGFTSPSKQPKAIDTGNVVHKTSPTALTHIVPVLALEMLSELLQQSSAQSLGFWQNFEDKGDFLGAIKTVCLQIKMASSEHFDYGDSSPPYRAIQAFEWNRTALGLSMNLCRVLISCCSSGCFSIEFVA
ncbi:hypothetical protein Ancab_004432 [Ancistrocladus abbreviatus]